VESDSQLPGSDLVAAGVADLNAGHMTVAGLLVAAARQRLMATGIPVPPVQLERPTHALYDLLEKEDAGSAHSRYNALIRRLVSYLRAAEHAAAR